VARVDLYAESGKPELLTDAIRNFHGGFLKWSSLAERPANVRESAFIRRRCMEGYRKDFAFVTYLETHDYIMPRGEGANNENALKVRLRNHYFRYAPGPLLAPTCTATPNVIHHVRMPAGRCCMFAFRSRCCAEWGHPAPCWLQ
jgi:hypothetical protein